MKKYIPFIMFSPLLLSLMACNDQTASNPTEQTVTETAATDEQQKDTNKAPKSAKQLWQESQQLSKDIWEKSKQSGEQLLDKSKKSSDEALQKSKKTTDELWQSTKENSHDIWLETQENSAEAWDDVKDKSKQVWLNGNQALETLIKTKEQKTESEKETENTTQLPDDET
jgi:predicted P-loop ATPase/GTPase